MFRSAWFSYARLLYLEGDMQCARCGPSPENTIWDSVTLAFNRKHLLPSLEPPTISQPSSIKRDTTRYITDQKLITDAPSRKLIQKVVKGPALVIGEEGVDDTGYITDDGEDGDEEDESTDGTRQKTSSKKNQQILDRLDAIPQAIQRVARTNAPLSRLLDMHFGLGSILKQRKAPDMYKHLFIQISADESVLQLANCSALGALKVFVESPSARNASALVDIPVLHETGCCYGMPKIREHPVYPKLKHDTRPDAGGKRGTKCSKQYGEKKLTGGIMCAWCTHSICYGFHCIPKGEGRNDVFSTLRVVYDFACARGPYCMTREPDLFADTLFVIDNFHATGHSKCAPAAFLKTYCVVDPQPRFINSSAGECGNSGISRIRKSVSYMSQDRAIVYTKVFLCIWNRQIIRGMAA
ncbi:hypothetical protein FB451DRAFT_1340257 [Mycena latifolia]|nr:hypothetical protein FB451DRAFT_1340257 [Mycena latifolia]